MPAESGLMMVDVTKPHSAAFQEVQLDRSTRNKTCPSPEGGERGGRGGRGERRKGRGGKECNCSILWCLCFQLSYALYCTPLTLIVC